ncbi:MAG: DNA cytosine methyltransferase, partial [Verrucomicrobiota bacterium]
MELVIDNFAGGGGASTGIEAAIGRPVDYAINHDPMAMKCHQWNHPKTTHLIEDVFAVKPAKLCAGRPVGLAWFSPDCRHHSKAKGAAPKRDRKVRGLAWVAVKWADQVRPRIIVLENVEEFEDWGPLDKRTGKPDPKRKGQYFKAFCTRLRNLSYNLEYRELVAADYGAPTTRKRLFLIARSDGQPIVWPEQTHAKDPENDMLCHGLKPWRTAAECIDWTIPCPSIFERKRPLVENTLRRIARGIQKFLV